MREKSLVAAPQHGVDVVDDRELGARLRAGRAEGLADGAGIGRAQLEAVADIDLDRVEEPAADEFGAGNQRHRRPHILLNQVETVGRRLVFQAVCLTGELLSRLRLIVPIDSIRRRIYAFKG